MRVLSLERVRSEGDGWVLVGNNRIDLHFGQDIGVVTQLENKQVEDAREAVNLGRISLDKRFGATLYPKSRNRGLDCRMSHSIVFGAEIVTFSTTESPVIITNEDRSIALRATIFCKE